MDRETIGLIMFLLPPLAMISLGLRALWKEAGWRWVVKVVGIGALVIAYYAVATFFFGHGS